MEDKHSLRRCLSNSVYFSPPVSCKNISSKLLPGLFANSLSSYIEPSAIFLPSWIITMRRQSFRLSLIYA